MKACHVYLIDTPYPTDSDIERRKFELLTHIYSCINHKAVNPDIPLVLITDPNTVRYYDDWQLTGLYDEVITHIHDDYPRERISRNFWASPKIWAMSKLHAPFVIFDTDIIVHRRLTDFTDCDLLYLHRETTAIYPNVFDITGPPGFLWDEEMVRCFRGTLPMNCAVVGMFNEAFKNDYVEKYFGFALDAPGDVQYANPNSHLMYPWSSAQIVTEQWLLAALAYYWAMVANTPIKTRAMVKALWASNDFCPLDMDLGPGPGAVAAELQNTFYHLWGAKKHQNNPRHAYYDLVRTTLLRGKYIVETSPQYDSVKDVFHRIVSQLEA
ncbi:MAG: DUF6734 family protein [Mycobacterium sp.]